MALIVVQLERMFRPAPRASQLIVTRVNGDLRQPRLERRGMRAVISPECEIGFGETVLDNFFDLFPLSEEATTYPRYMTAMALEQLLERSFITGGNRRHQRIVCLLF